LLMNTHGNVWKVKEKGHNDGAPWLPLWRRSSDYF
jgi:hypothetical protein